jgi:hypothetical protein
MDNIELELNMGHPFNPGVRVWTVSVPTETGTVAVIDVRWDLTNDTYGVKFAGEILDQSPEGLTAAVQVALLSIKATR